MVLNPFFQNIRDNTEWLYRVIFEYKWFYYDLWSFVHFWSGAMLFVLLTAFKNKNRWLTLFLILVLFEIVESMFFIAILKLFRPEKIVDVLNDIFIGMLGGYLISCFFKWNKNRKYSQWLAVFVAAITVAFLWVGWYGYSYNIPFFNSSYINWWALNCWTLAGVAMIVVFQFIKQNKNIVFDITVVWIVYLILLFAVEYISYHFLYFREITEGATPLIFDIVHGTPVMHVFYVTAPIYFIGLYILFSDLFRKCKNEYKY